MKDYSEEKYPHKEITEKIIGAAYAVHNRLGHSFQEKVYENALVKELQNHGLTVEQQKGMKVNYGGEPIGDFIVDLLVEDKIIVELKAVHSLERAFEDKLLHYLKVSGLEIGLLINFGKSVEVKRKIFSQPNSVKSVISDESVKSADISDRGAVGREFVATCRRHLMEEYFPKIEQCILDLSDDDIWWRAHETDNSIGNLILHLSGNIRQWIISGIGGATDARNRPQEFAEREHIPREELLKKFKETLTEADRVLEQFNVNRLLEVRRFQKWEYTCLYAISHVVEHVAQHMGQIIYITKLRKGVDLKFFNL
jgi:GxxExxY protein